MDEARPTCATETEWMAYQRFLPPRMAIRPDNAPREDWVRACGADLHVDRYDLPGAPIKVIGLHGGGGYGRMFTGVGFALRDHGFETLIPDLPGYGLTRVPRRRLTYDLWVDCVGDLIDHERKRDDRPIVLLGMSLGGMLAYHAAARIGTVSRLVVTNLLDLREPAVRVGVARSRALGTFGPALFDALGWLVDPVPLPMRLVGKMSSIANNAELVRVVSRDPLGGATWVPARFLRTLMTYAPASEPESFWHCPVLLLHPAADRWTAPGLSLRFFDRLAGPKKVVLLDNAGHFPVEEPGISQLEDELVAFVRGIATGSAATDRERE